ncbi:T9SS type A sorting domain-containing protein [Cryomorpha ignava]|uniref:T9SS type A sorting domain-containing protein n=1 Tax=Cryomorpha ignava TaxID=101383 RepID=A0A7K3WRR9_9FLAO|nr:T9SS type A sorting domain-containing protein [Cryomorpha ignava]NEN24370.1 T9SS type A sorting domain-containing protein [Cryomorpha ignava]
MGANVPLGIRLAVDDLYNLTYGTELMGDYEEDLNDAYDVVNSPAALQMLLYSFDDFDWDTQVWDSSTRNHFSNELYLKGFPLTCENIAIAKGNGIGAEQNFGSLAPLFNADIQNNFNCFAYLADIYGLVEFDDDNGIGEQALNQFIGSFIKSLTFIGVRADVEIDVNAMPGYVPESYQIYERKIQIRVAWVIPYVTFPKKVKVAYSYPYDSCPGSTYSVENFSIAGSDLEALLDGTYAPCLELHERDFCFVPTFSALDIYDYRLAPYTPIDPVDIVANNKTPFDKCFLLDPTLYSPANSAPTNESHTSFSPSNISPFSAYISPSFNAVNEYPTVHGYTFNFGYAAMGNNLIKTTDKISHPLTVSGISAANGALWINRADNLANVNDNSNPISTSGHFSVNLKSDCAGDYGRVTVETLGAIIIGEDNTKTADVIVRDNSWIVMNDGFIEVRDGSRLIIEDGGVLRLNGGILRIQDGGEVIIKAGGKLIYEKDTQIELNGNNAVLALGGLTHIGNDATFTFTYQGTESGYIRMLEEGYAGQRFSAGLNAKVELQGADEDDLILYMEEGSDFAEFVGAVYGESYSSQKFDQVKFKDGKIIMEDQAIIILLNTSFFTRTIIESLDITHNPRGIKPLTTCYITSSTLNRMTIDAHLYYSGMGPLFIGSSEVNNSNVHVRGYGYNLQNCNFNYSEIFSYDTPMGNTILRSNFNNAGTAVEDDSDSELFVYQSNFYENGAGIAKRRGRVTPKCTNFEGNNTAIIGYQSSEINLSTLYNGGYNNFRDNSLNIFLLNAYELQMEDGYNEFYDGTNMNIVGNLDISMSLCAYPIKAYNNIWTPLSDTSVPYGDLNHPDMAEFQVVIGQPVGPPWAQNCPAKFSFGPVAPITICGKYDDPKEPIIIIEGPKSNGSDTDFPLLTSPTYFTDTPFDYALRVAAYSTTIADTINGDDLIAADKYYELLHLAEMDSLPNDSIASVMEKMRWSSLNNYKATIERLFTDSILSRSNNQSTFDPTVQNYVNVLMAFTDSIKTAENYKRQFQLELWKAALLRTIGKKQQALHIISNINYCDHDSVQRIILLEQIQKLEFEIARSQIDINTFLSDSITFVLDSTIYEIPLESYIDSTGFGSYIMSPNSILFSSCNTASARPSQSTLGSFDLNVVLFPNPTQNFVNISFLDGYPNSESILTLRIFELTGKEVFNAKLPPQNSRVDLPSLANALYLYRIELDDKLVDQGKLSIIE